MTKPASAASVRRASVANGGLFGRDDQVRSPAPRSVIASSVVLSETQSAMPSTSPVKNIRELLNRPPVRTTSAAIQRPFQRLSVRYSIDLRKNEVLRPRISADQK